MPPFNGSSFNGPSFNGSFDGPPLGEHVSIIAAIGPGRGTICLCDAYDEATGQVTLVVLGYPSTSAERIVVCRPGEFVPVQLQDVDVARAKDWQRKAYSRRRPGVGTMLSAKPMVSPSRHYARSLSP